MMIMRACMKGDEGTEAMVLQHVLQWMPRSGWAPMEASAEAVREQHARGLLTAEARDALLPNWAFVLLERSFERYHKLGPRDVRHGITAMGACLGYEADALLVDYHVELASAGRGFSTEGFAALKAAEVAVVEWGQTCGLTLPGLELRVEPIVHVAQCRGCGKYVGREAIRATLQAPWGRRYTREYAAVVRQ